MTENTSGVPWRKPNVQQWAKTGIVILFVNILASLRADACISLHSNLFIFKRFLESIVKTTRNKLCPL